MMSGQKEDAVYEWIDLELARQRREELLREAHEARMAHASARAVETVGQRTALVRRLLRSVWPGGNAGVATAERPGTPVGGCSAD